tara:strand:- start:195 stop:941 length:747 start_codon:yes stop_codon:yes gene_type:complete
MVTSSRPSTPVPLQADETREYTTPDTRSRAVLLTSGKDMTTLDDAWDEPEMSPQKTCGFRKAGDDKLFALLQAASSIDENDSAATDAYDTAYTTEKEALLMCVRQHDVNGDVLKYRKNIGIFEKDGKFLVQTTGDLRVDAFRMSQFDHIQFKWLKAFDREHRHSKNQHTMIKLGVCTKLSPKPHSVIKKAYKLPNKKVMKLMHHSCAYLNLPHDRSCDNCIKNNNVSPDRIIFKCKRGEDMWHLCDSA